MPIVVFHSANDRLIPLQAARDLFAKITAPKRMIETGGGHNGAGFCRLDALRDTMWTFWPPAVNQPHRNARGVGPGGRTASGPVAADLRNAPHVVEAASAGLQADLKVGLAKPAAADDPQRALRRIKKRAGP